MPTQSPFAVFLFSFGVSFGAVISPGPVSAAIVTESPRQGWLVGPLVATAHILLEAVIVILINFGLTAGMTDPAVENALALAGGLLLLFIGGRYLLGVWRGNLHLPEPDWTTPPRSVGGLLALGALTTISNPFWYAWWMTFAAGFLAQTRVMGALGPAVFYLGHISADYAWDTFLSVATSVGGRWLTDRRYRLLIAATGGFMIYLGVAFLRTGLGFGIG